MLQIAAIAEFSHDAERLALDEGIVKLNDIFVVEFSQQISFALRLVLRVFAVRRFAARADVDDFDYETFFFRIN